MRDALIDILGEYNPSGDYFGGADWEFIATAVVFCICLWFTFSFIRTFFCGIMNRRY